MKSLPIRAVIILVWIGCLAGFNWSAPATQGRLEYRPGVVLVGIAPGTSKLAQQSFRTVGELRVLTTTAELDLMEIRVRSGSELALLNELQHNPAVRFAELDYAISIEGIDSSHSLRASRAQFSEDIPNDPLFSSQWALEKIRATQAWSVQSDSQELVIAVLDTGIQLDHPDLVDALWVNGGEIPANQIDDDRNGKIDDVHGWHFYQSWDGSQYISAEDAILTDDHGHGSHVSGIIAATTNNGVGIAGLARGASLMVVKVLEKYGGFYSDISRGIIYAVDNGAKIINLSLGGSYNSETLKAAIEYAVGKGVIIVAAVGNQNSTVLYPAAYPEVIAVAASNELDQRASFSNFGPEVDMTAPGVDILSTWNRSNYVQLSGTSMAAPLVTGAAALTWSHHFSLDASEVEEILCETSYDIEKLGKDVWTGCGRVDAFRALAKLEEYPDLWVKTQSPDTILAGQTLTITWTYGNSGYGPAQEVEIKPSITSSQLGLIYTESTTYPLLHQGVAFSLSYSFIPLNKGDIIISSIEIFSPSPGLSTINNLSIHETRINYPFFFPLIRH